MYCSSCGNSINRDLNYCKNCGARVGDAKEHDSEKISEASFNLLVSALIAVPIVGLGIIIGLLSVMKEELGFANDMILAITFMSFVLLLTSEGALIWLLMHRTKGSKATKHTAQMKDVVIKGLGEAHAQRLSEPIPSVIENTTRNLEPVYREPRSQ